VLAPPSGKPHGGQKGDITPDWIEAFLHTQMESGRACRAAAAPVPASPGISLIDRLESCLVFQAPRYHLSLDAPRLGVVECAGIFMHEDGGKPAAAAAAALRWCFKDDVPPFALACVFLLVYYCSAII